MDRYFLVCYFDYDHSFVLGVHTSLEEAEDCREDFRDAIRGYRAKAVEVGAKSEWDIYEWMRDNVEEQPFDYVGMYEPWRVGIVAFNEINKSYSSGVGRGDDAREDAEM